MATWIPRGLVVVTLLAALLLASVSLGALLPLLPLLAAGVPGLAVAAPRMFSRN